MKKDILRVIAAGLAAAFLAQELGYCAPAELFVAQQTPIQGLLADPTRLDAPLEHAILQEVHKGTNGKLIIHIQDAHSNLSGQQNLSGALDALMSAYKISLVLSEGGEADCSLTDLKKVGTPALWKIVADKYLHQGRIGGQEYLNLTSENPIKIMGVEDSDLYWESVAAYGRLAERRDETLVYLRAIQTSLDKLKKKLYPAPLFVYDQNTRKEAREAEVGVKGLIKLAREQGLSLDEFENLSNLSALLDKEKGIDFQLANLEQASLVEAIDKAGGRENIEQFIKKSRQIQGQKVSQYAYFQNVFAIANEKHVDLSRFQNLTRYRDYLEEFTRVDLDRVLEEMTAAEDRLYASLLSSDDARSVRAIDRYVSLLVTAYRIQMTTRDFKLFEANETDFTTVSYLGFMNRKLAEFGYFEDLVPYRQYLEEGKKALVDFYASVDKRDAAFVRHAEEYLGAEDQKAAFLITGGYHTAHLKKLFTEKGYSFAVLTPYVTSETNQKKYEDLLLEPVRPKIETVKAVSGESRSRRSEGVMVHLAKMPGPNGSPLAGDVAEEMRREVEAMARAGLRAAETDRLAERAMDVVQRGKKTPPAKAAPGVFDLVEQALPLIDEPVKKAGTAGSRLSATDPVTGLPLEIYGDSQLGRSVKLFPEFFRQFGITLSEDGLIVVWEGLGKVNAVVRAMGLAGDWVFVPVKGVVSMKAHLELLAGHKIPIGDVHDLEYHLGSFLMLMRFKEVMDHVSLTAQALLEMGKNIPAGLSEADRQRYSKAVAYAIQRFSEHLDTWNGRFIKDLPQELTEESVERHLILSLRRPDVKDLWALFAPSNNPNIDGMGWYFGRSRRVVRGIIRRSYNVSIGLGSIKKIAKELFVILRQPAGSRLTSSGAAKKAEFSEENIAKWVRDGRGSAEVTASDGKVFLFTYEKRGSKRFLSVFDGDEMIGFAHFHIDWLWRAHIDTNLESSETIFKHRVLTYQGGLRVADEYSRAYSGIGTTLMGLVVRLGRADHVGRIFLETVSATESGPRVFYERLGYTVTNQTPSGPSIAMTQPVNAQAISLAPIRIEKSKASAAKAAVGSRLPRRVSAASKTGRSVSLFPALYGNLGFKVVEEDLRTVVEVPTIEDLNSGLKAMGITGWSFYEYTESGGTVPHWRFVADLAEGRIPLGEEHDIELHLSSYLLFLQSPMYRNHVRQTAASLSALKNRDISGLSVDDQKNYEATLKLESTDFMNAFIEFADTFLPLYVSKDERRDFIDKAVRINFSLQQKPLKDRLLERTAAASIRRLFSGADLYSGILSEADTAQIGKDLFDALNAGTAGSRLRGADEEPGSPPSREARHLFFRATRALVIGALVSIVSMLSLKAYLISHAVVLGASGWWWALGLSFVAGALFDLRGLIWHFFTHLHVEPHEVPEISRGPDDEGGEAGARLGGVRPVGTRVSIFRGGMILGSGLVSVFLGSSLLPVYPALGLLVAAFGVAQVVMGIMVLTGISVGKKKGDRVFFTLRAVAMLFVGAQSLMTVGSLGLWWIPGAIFGGLSIAVGVFHLWFALTPMTGQKFDAIDYFDSAPGVTTLLMAVLAFGLAHDLLAGAFFLVAAMAEFSASFFRMDGLFSRGDDGDDNEGDGGGDGRAGSRVSAARATAQDGFRWTPALGSGGILMMISGFALLLARVLQMPLAVTGDPLGYFVPLTIAVLILGGLTLVQLVLAKQGESDDVASFERQDFDAISWRHVPAREAVFLGTGMTLLFWGILAYKLISPPAAIASFVMFLGFTWMALWNRAPGAGPIRSQLSSVLVFDSALSVVLAHVAALLSMPQISAVFYLTAAVIFIMGLNVGKDAMPGKGVGAAASDRAVLMTASLLLVGIFSWALLPAKVLFVFLALAVFSLNTSIYMSKEARIGSALMAVAGVSTLGLFIYGAISSLAPAALVILSAMTFLAVLFYGMAIIARLRSDRAARGEGLQRASPAGSRLSESEQVLGALATYLSRIVDKFPQEKDGKVLWYFAGSAATMALLLALDGRFDELVVEGDNAALQGTPRNLGPEAMAALEDFVRKIGDLDVIRVHPQDPDFVKPRLAIDPDTQAAFAGEKTMPDVRFHRPGVDAAVRIRLKNGAVVYVASPIDQLYYKTEQLLSRSAQVNELLQRQKAANDLTVMLSAFTKIYPRDEVLRGLAERIIRDGLAEGDLYFPYDDKDLQALFPYDDKEPQTLKVAAVKAFLDDLLAASPDHAYFSELAVAHPNSRVWAPMILQILGRASTQTQKEEMVAFLAKNWQRIERWDAVAGRPSDQRPGAQTSEFLKVLLFLEFSDSARLTEQLAKLEEIFFQDFLAISDVEQIRTSMRLEEKAFGVVLNDLHEQALAAKKAKGSRIAVNWNYSSGYVSRTIIETLGLREAVDASDTIELADGTAGEGLRVFRVRLPAAPPGKTGLAEGIHILRQELGVDGQPGPEEYYFLFDDSGELIAVVPAYPDGHKDKTTAMFLAPFNIPVEDLRKFQKTGSGQVFRESAGRIERAKQQLLSFAGKRGFTLELKQQNYYALARFDHANVALTSSGVKPEEMVDLTVGGMGESFLLLPVLPSVYGPWKLDHDLFYYESVYREALRTDFSKNGNILDAATGTGFLMWLQWIAAQRTGQADSLRFHAYDINPMAAANARLLARDILGLDAEIRTSSSPEGVFGGTKFRLITANSPSMQSDEPTRTPALGVWDGQSAGKAFAEQLSKALPSLLAADGVLLLWYHRGDPKPYYEKNGLVVEHLMVNERLTSNWVYRVYYAFGSRIGGWFGKGAEAEGIAKLAAELRATLFADFSEDIRTINSEDSAAFKEALARAGLAGEKATAIGYIDHGFDLIVFELPGKYPGLVFKFHRDLKGGLSDRAAAAEQTMKQLLRNARAAGREITVTPVDGWKLFGIKGLLAPTRFYTTKSGVLMVQQRGDVIGSPQPDQAEGLARAAQSIGAEFEDRKPENMLLFPDGKGGFLPLIVDIRALRARDQAGARIALVASAAPAGIANAVRASSAFSHMVDATARIGVPRETLGSRIAAPKPFDFVVEQIEEQAEAEKELASGSGYAAETLVRLDTVLEILKTIEADIAYARTMERIRVGLEAAKSELLVKKSGASTDDIETAIGAALAELQAFDGQEAFRAALENIKAELESAKLSIKALAIVRRSTATSQQARGFDAAHFFGRNMNALTPEEYASFASVFKVAMALKVAKTAAEARAALEDEASMTLFAEIYSRGRNREFLYPFLFGGISMNALIRFVDKEGEPHVAVFDTEGNELASASLASFVLKNKARLVEPVVVSSEKAMEIARKATVVDLALAEVEKLDGMLAVMGAAALIKAEGRRTIILQRGIPSGPNVTQTVLKSWYEMQSVIDKRIKEEADKIGIAVFIQYLTAEDEVVDERSDSVSGIAASENAKTMRIGDLSDAFLLAAAKALSGVIPTERRVSLSGELNYLPDGPMGVLAIMVAFEGELFSEQDVKRALSPYMQKVPGDLTLLKRVDEKSATEQAYRDAGLFIQASAIAYNVILTLYRTMEKAVAAAA